MALWQFRLILLPERVLLKEYDTVPSVLSMEMAEDFGWWLDVQPPPDLERQMDSILPPKKSWSSSVTMWGNEDSNDAYVSYADEGKRAVEEIAFRIDARVISTELVSAICTLAHQLGCMLMTADYKILLPEESVLSDAINNSTAKRFLEDPESTLQSLDQVEIERRLRYLEKSEN